MHRPDRIELPSPLGKKKKKSVMVSAMVEHHHIEEIDGLADAPRRVSEKQKPLPDDPLSETLNTDEMQPAASAP